MKIIFLLAVAAAAALTGCSQSNEEAKRQGEVIAHQRNNENGSRAPATAFDYKRVQYATDGSCAKGSLYFRYLSVEDVKLGQTAEGNDILVDADVLLYSNGQYEVEYTEKYITDYTDTGYRYKKQKVRNFAGHWNEIGGKLVLDDLMDVSAQEVEGKVVGSVLYKKDIVTVGLRGTTARAVNVWSSAAIRSYREMCPNEQDVLGSFEKFRARNNLETNSLNGLASTERMTVSNVEIRQMHLILHTNGSYHVMVLARVPADGYSSERPYTLESGSWERMGQMLKLYHGMVSMAYGGVGVDLRFTRDVVLFDDVNQKAYSLALTGKSVKLMFSPSPFNMDDLTDTYR